MKNDTATAALSLLSNEADHDPIEDRLRETIRAPVEAVFEEEPEAFPGRSIAAPPKIQAHHHLAVMGAFGSLEAGALQKRAVVFS
ncbi:MAG: hypothetical protein Q4P24_16285 [Rhodobacterales bacterium]|nr:hypothetical protein [Rhodobacterales bacterium]